MLTQQNNIGIINSATTVQLNIVSVQGLTTKRRTKLQWTVTEASDIIVSRYPIFPNYGGEYRVELQRQIRAKSNNYIILSIYLLVARLHWCFNVANCAGSTSPEFGWLWYRSRNSFHFGNDSSLPISGTRHKLARLTRELRLPEHSDFP